MAYQNAVRAIATEALNGDDTSRRIAHLAASFRMTAANVSYDVDEMIDLLKD